MDTTVKPPDQIEDRILVIDDDAIMRELLLLLLGAEGHTVITADSGDDALALLAGLEPEQFPSVVLTDLKMPGLSHSELALRLGAVCPSNTVLLAMSASEPTAGETIGFHSFLRKPFSISDYDATVEQSRSQNIAAADSQPTETESGPAGQAVPALDEIIFSRICSTMSGAHVLDIYTMCLNDATTRSERMSAASAVNDAVTFVREAHAVKGGCGMLGATELYSLAGRMETGGLGCSSLLHDFGPAIARLRRILEERIDRNVDEHTDF